MVKPAKYAYGNVTDEGLYVRRGEVILHSSGVIMSDLSTPDLSYWQEDDTKISFFNNEKSATYEFKKCVPDFLPSYESGLLLWKLEDKPITFKILVASHKDYINKTGIVENLLHAGVPLDEVYFVISGEETELEEESTNVLYTKRNFWEYGALLRAAEKEEDAPDYWFLIHDTTLIGPRFYDNLKQFCLSPGFDVVSLNEDNQFNIGFYKHDFLVSIKDYLLSLEGMTKEEGIKVEVEAHIRKLSSYTSCFCSGAIRAYKGVQVWGETQRLEFYLPFLDLYKYVAYIGGNPDDSRGFFAKHPEKP